MNVPHTTTAWSRDDLHRLHDAAHAQAAQLRSQAIGDFVSAVAGLLRDPVLKVSHRLRGAARPRKATETAALPARGACAT